MKYDTCPLRSFCLKKQFNMGLKQAKVFVSAQFPELACARVGLTVQGIVIRILVKW